MTLAVIQGYMNFFAYGIYCGFKEKHTEPDVERVPLVAADNLPDVTPALMTDCKLLIAYDEKDEALFIPTV